MQIELAGMYKTQNRLAEAEVMPSLILASLYRPLSTTALAYAARTRLIEIYIMAKKSVEAESSLQKLQNLTSHTQRDLKKHILLYKAWLRHAQGNVA
ncbi:MAG: hypothetical protein VKN56_08060 [Cyanobacteriota bacterium]|nr:hypothetical protein [Cyanobacteriota bacterium]